MVINLSVEGQKIFPNCLEINNEYLYVGDSKGTIQVFSMDYTYQKFKVMKIKEINIQNNKSIINDIKFIQNENSLLVLSRNNSIKLINLKNEKIPNIYSQGKFSS